MQLEDSYINTSLMSVLLFNLQRGVQRCRRASGPGRRASGIRPRCWLDCAEPGLRHGAGAAASPGVRPHADPLPLAGLVQTLTPTPGASTAPHNPDSPSPFLARRGVETGSCLLAYRLASSKRRTFEREKGTKNTKEKEKGKKTRKKSQGRSSPQVVG